MGMAGIDVAPGVDDGDDRLVGEILARIPHLQHAGAMAEGAQVLDAKPAMAAQVLRLELRHGFFCCCDSIRRKTSLGCARQHPSHHLNTGYRGETEPATIGLTPGLASASILCRQLAFSGDRVRRGLARSLGEEGEDTLEPRAGLRAHRRRVTAGPIIEAEAGR